MIFSDRRDAGKQLAAALKGWAGRNDVIVLALPRGGVPVAYEIAMALHAPLDLMLVRKLGVPQYEEVAMGAIAYPDITVFNAEVIQDCGVSHKAIESVIAKEREELARRDKQYRRNRPRPALENCVVILVDDGMATGADMRAAVASAKQQRAAQVIVAVPTASTEAIESLKLYADVVICLFSPRPFWAVGQAYDDFSQTYDEEVTLLLDNANMPRQMAG